MNCRKKELYWLGVFAACFLMGISCANPDHPEGLAKSGGGTGPVIWFDPLAKPVPEIPFPNDLATTLDVTTITGRRINISEEAPTAVERDDRKNLNSLDGFGTYSPLSVRFDKPVDLRTINDGSVLLIKLLDPKAGDVVPIDLGKGFFPTIWRPDTAWWAHDPLWDANNIVMDPANMADLNGDSVPEFVDFYEYETNTLILRPIYPLEEASRYAVVLLKNMTGLDGQSVRSPFEYINHTMQTDDLKPVVGLLQSKGIPIEQVAFVWSFTTQSVTADWVNVWNGLNYGAGPLGYLASAFPARLSPTDLQLVSDGDGNSYTLSAAWFEPILKTVATLLGEDDYVAIADFRYIDYFVFGTFESPGFFTDTNFGNPLLTPAKYFDVAKLSGQIPAERLKVTWMLTVPRDEDMGLDGCQNPPDHPFGCKDSEEAGAKGLDNQYGFAGIDDNSDGWIDDAGEYLAVGSDDVPDPACDNYYPSPDAYPANCAALCLAPAPGALALTPIPPGGACSGTQGNGELDGNGLITEDANGDGRLNTAPFPVAFYGHGHTSSRVESIGFAGPMAQFGISLFGMDNFGHGPMTEFANLDIMVKQLLVSQGVDLSEVCDASSMSPACLGIFGLLVQTIGADLNGDKVINFEDMDGKTIDQVITEIFHLGFFNVLGNEGRGYDTDGDTVPNSGDIFWTANIFQTRDLVRQTAIDWMQFVRIVDMFGTQTTTDMNGDTIADTLDGDFNRDGKYDLGGPTSINNRGDFFFGSSLGGIMGDVNMGVNPRMLIGAPVAGAGGLADVVPRSHQRSATRPIMLHICGPLVIGNYEGVPGRVILTWNDDPASKAFGYLYLPSYGIVQVNNLSNGQSKLVTADIDGNFAIGIAADIGDLIQIVSLNDTTGPIQSSVVTNTPFKGLGHRRNSPDLRRFIALAQWAIERGDAINLAPHYFTGPRGRPLQNYPDKSILQINTTGDPNVPINTGNSIGTAAGLWTLDEAQQLIDKSVNIGYVPASGYPSPIFDPEDLDDDDLDCGFTAADPRCVAGPKIAPLPVIPVAGGTRVSAMRWPYVNEKGHHAFALPGAINHGIDWGVYMANQIGYFFASDGTCVIDDPWELHAAPMIMPGANGILDTAIGGDDNIHNIRLLTTLGFNDCGYPFPTVDVITTGLNFVLDSALSGDDVLIDYDGMYRGP